MTGLPRVTAIVPTMGTRPALLRRAIDSIWRQTDVEVDVVLVVDGPPDRPLPSGVADHPRIEVVRLAGHRGQRAALDAGVARARAPWVAFLDDDDEWHAREKLARQIAAATARPGPVIVSSRVVLEINGRPVRIAPTRRWNPGDDLGEYAFCADRQLRFGLIQQSTLLTSTEVARAHPFRGGGDAHPDIELVLRCVGSGTEFVQLPEALSTWRIDDERVQMSTSRTWRETLVWCDEHASLLTDRAYAGALLVAGARSTDSRRAMPAIWRHAWRGGRPGTPDLIASLYLAYLPNGIRRRITRSFRPRRAPSTPMGSR